MEVRSKNPFSPAKTPYLSIKHGANSFKTNAAVYAVKTLSENPIYTLVFLDFFGMVFPRTAIDTFRNRKELGHFNYDAGRETLLRESITAIVMSLVPGIIAVKLGERLLTAKNNPHQLNTTLFTDRKTLEKAKSIMDELLLQYKNHEGVMIDVLDFRKQFAEKYLQKGDFSSTFVKKALSYLDQTTNLGHTDLLKNKVVSTVQTAVEPYKETGKQTISIFNLLKDANQATKDTFYKGIIKLKNKVTDQITDHLAKEVTAGKDGLKFFGTNVHYIIRDMFTVADDVILKAYSFFDARHEARPPIAPDLLGRHIDTIYTNLKRLKNIKLFAAVGTTLAYAFIMPKANIYLTQKLSGRKDFVGIFGLTDRDKNHNKQTISSESVKHASSQESKHE